MGFKNLFYRFFIYKSKFIYSLNVSPGSIKGKHVRVLSNTYIDKDSSIGDYTFIGRNCEITKSLIGRYCSIASYVQIGMGEHDLKKISISGSFYTNEDYEKLTSKCLEIGNDVWIGAGVLIRRGVKIGDGAVIGANSFVNSNIPEFAIAVGSPAKVIGYRFPKEMQKKILLSNWWSFDRIEALKIIKILENESVSNINS